jgi:TRAP-type C4-dicarboxylate transport system substrate-binding protein
LRRLPVATVPVVEAQLFMRRLLLLLAVAAIGVTTGAATAAELNSEWIKMGAPDPREAPKTIASSKLSGLTEKARQHWAFIEFWNLFGAWRS